MSFCTNCGTQLGDNLKFCMSCGAKIEREKEEFVKPPKQNNFMKNIAIFLVFAIAAFLFTKECILQAEQKATERLVKDFWGANELSNNDNITSTSCDYSNFKVGTPLREIMNNCPSVYLGFDVEPCYEEEGCRRPCTIFAMIRDEEYVYFYCLDGNDVTDKAASEEFDKGGGTLKLSDFKTGTKIKKVEKISGQ